MSLRLSETDLLHRFVEAVPGELPDVRVFRRNIINRTVTENGRTYQLRNGIAGQCDAYALTRGGMHIEIETKAARGTLRAAQEAWRAFCVAWNIPHVVFRAMRDEPADDTVSRWINDLRTVLETFDERPR